MEDPDFTKNISNIHYYTTYRTAPKRAPKILVIGPVGSGKTTISSLLSQKFKLGCINFPELLGEHKNKSSHLNQEVCKKIHNAIENGDLVEDGIVNSILTQRLIRKDVNSLGFALDGYPKTAEQMNFMEET